MVVENLQVAQFRVNVPGVNGGVRQQGKKAAAQLLQPSREGIKWIYKEPPPAELQNQPKFR